MEMKCNNSEDRKVEVTYGVTIGGYGLHGVIGVPNEIGDS